MQRNSPSRDELPRDLKVVSVPHTGTRFTKSLLGVEEHRHTTADLFTVLKWAKGGQIIIPLRKPEDVWRSWHNRRKYDKRHKQLFSEAWKRLDEVYQVSQDPVFFFPIDVPDKDVYLMELSVLTGKTLTTNWEKEGHEIRNVEKDYEEHPFIRHVYRLDFIRKIYRSG